ncbi:hypothetical protein RhiirA4_486928 [Rhizophagus irregularis]|uniref:C2H2-type domain-containing protein n=1 Tax=Rhizophagus irregularis TaxID=588596 RepID=A0A2I1HS12_9GLOM|nr:hypothetical protein RhiirA4_486928 [Rhizophagus irregularis]
MIFKCSYCSRNFSRRAALRNHIKIHGSTIDSYLQEIANERNNTIILDENNDEEQCDGETYRLEDAEESFNQQEQQEEMVYDNETDIDRETNVETYIEREYVEVDVGKEINMEVTNIIEDVDNDVEEDEVEDDDVDEREMEDDEDEKIQEDVEFELIDVEYPPVAKNIDITTSDKIDFPSKEFGNFMSLLVKWDLSDACSNEILKFSKSIARDDVVLPTSVKQGRKFLDQLAKPHTSFKKVPIMKYNNETYYLHYRQIFDTIKELLSNNDIFEHCVFKFTPLYNRGQRIYSEQFNGKWWEKTQNTLPNVANILSIILYSDATTCDQIGKLSEHPVKNNFGKKIKEIFANKKDFVS